MATGMRNDPYGNYNFMVEIDGITQAGFREVVMPDASVQVIEYREGNEPTKVRKLAGLTSYGNVILKWGCTDSHELYDWWKTSEQGKPDRKNMSIILLDRERNEVKRWNVLQAWPIWYSIGDLEAEGDEVLIETLELTHEGFELVTG